MTLRLFQNKLQKVYKTAVEMLDHWRRVALVQPAKCDKRFMTFNLVKDHPETLFRRFSQSKSNHRTTPQLEQPLVAFNSRQSYCNLEEVETTAPLKLAPIILDKVRRVCTLRWNAPEKNCISRAKPLSQTTRLKTGHDYNTYGDLQTQASFSTETGFALEYLL